MEGEIKVKVGEEEKVFKAEDVDKLISDKGEVEATVEGLKTKAVAGEADRPAQLQTRSERAEEMPRAGDQAR